jgi:hypothetical protein
MNVRQVAVRCASGDTNYNKTTLMNKRFQNFQEFWPYYVQQHSRSGTRLLHFAGTTFLFVFLFHAFLTHSILSLIAGVVSAYGCAWIGHFLIEKNRPATFRCPLLSLMGDFKMYAFMLTGRMQREAELITKR